MSGFWDSVSFREKSLWFETGIMVYVWVWYFGEVGDGLFDGSVTRAETFGLFIGMIVVLIILTIWSQIVLAFISPKDANAATDERDTLIARRAGNTASFMLGAGVVTIAIHAMFKDISAIVMVHELVLMLIAVEVATGALQILYYRRGH